MIAAMSSASCFSSDPDFCSECGTILPLPGPESTVKCVGCNFRVSVKNFDGMTVTYEIKFNNKGRYKKKEESEKDSASLGPFVDRECSKCGNQRMTYETLQTRSADEGQTVFYHCPKCQHHEHEYS